MKKTNIPEITLAELLKINPHESIKVPEKLLKALKSDGNFAIIILTPNTKIIRIIPTSNNKVYKIEIDIGTLAPDFLRKIGNLFLKLGLRALYSTGLCFIEEKCVFDGYIDSIEFEKVDIEELKKEILSVDGIKGVEISSLLVE